eukprot:251957_1
MLNESKHQTELLILQSQTNASEEKTPFHEWYDSQDLTNGKLEVGIKFEIYEITHVDTSAQQYGIRALMRIDWKATKNDIKNFEQNNKETYTAEFEPEISFTNYVSLNQYEYRPTIITQTYNEKCLYINVVFTEEFEVASFPFDVQDLTMAFTQHSTIGMSIITVPSHVSSSYIRFDHTWSSITNWTVVNIDAAKVELPTKSANVGAVYEIVMFRIQAKRKWKGIVYRLLLWLLFLGVMSWATFAVDASEIGDRLSYSITMALTIVAFQFIISDQLPQVNYLTLLDKYNLYIFSIIILITLETTIVGYDGVGLVDNADEVDNNCSIVAILLFVVGNIGFVIYAMYLINIEDKKIGKWNTFVKNVDYVFNKDGKGIIKIPYETKKK